MSLTKQVPLTYLNQGVVLSDSVTYKEHRVKIKAINGRATLIIELENIGDNSCNYKIEGSSSFNGLDSPLFTIKGSTALAAGNKTTQQIKLHTNLYDNNKFDELGDEILIKVTKVSGSTELKYYGIVAYS